MIIYLLIINILAGILFAYDKYCARHNKWRVPELWLHLLELLGGCFAILLLMYTIRHKNRKFKYYFFTFLSLLLWLFLFHLSLSAFSAIAEID